MHIAGKCILIKGIGHIDSRNNNDYVKGVALACSIDRRIR